MYISDRQIQEALTGMEAKAIGLGLVNGEVMIAIEVDHKPLALVLYASTIGNISREPRDGDPGRNYEGTAFAKLAFSRRTHLPSGKYPNNPPKIGETDLKGSVPIPTVWGWVYFVCAGLHNKDDDVQVCSIGCDILLPRLRAEHR